MHNKYVESGGKMSSLKAFYNNCQTRGQEWGKVYTVIENASIPARFSWQNLPDYWPLPLITCQELPLPHLTLVPWQLLAPCSWVMEGWLGLFHHAFWSHCHPEVTHISYPGLGPKHVSPNVIWLARRFQRQIDGGQDLLGVSTRSPAVTHEL